MKKTILAALVLATTLVNAQTFNPTFNWVKKTSPTGFAQPEFLVREQLIKTEVDAGGNVYSAIRSVRTEDPLTDDIKIIKYSPSGTVLFEKKLRQFNPTKDLYIVDLKVKNNAIYIIGSSDTGPFNPSFSNVTTNNLTQAEGTIYYAAKYDASNMNLVWAKKLDFSIPGGSRSDQNTSFILNRLIVDNNGDAIVMGVGTEPDAVFDPIWRNAYVFKYSSTNGNVLWKKIINSSNVMIEDAAVDASNNIFIVGNYEEEIKFGSTIGLTLTTANNQTEMMTTFLVKYSSTGSPVFAKKLHDLYFDPAGLNFKRRILVEEARIHVFGEYQQASVKMSPTSTITGPGIYWARYTPAGVFQSALKVPGSADPDLVRPNKLEDVKINPNGSRDVYLAIRTMAKSIAVAKYRANTTNGYLLLGTKTIALGQDAGNSTNQLSYNNYSSVCINLVKNTASTTGGYFIYVSGEFEAMTDFDWGTAATNLNVTGGAYYSNSFLAKYTAASNNARLAKDGEDGEETDENQLTEQDIVANELADESLSFDVYPNPAQDKVTINLAVASENETYTLKIYDVKGSVVVNQQLTPASFSETITTDYLENGIYLIELSSVAQRITKKLIKN